MDWGSILTSSASGSCRRRAMLTAPRMRHVQVGQLCAGQPGGRIDRGPRLADDGVLQRLAARTISSATNCSVSRLAVPLPMAMTSTPAASTAASQHLLGLVPPPLRLVGIDGRRAQHLAGGVHHGHLAAGAVAGIDAHHHPARAAAAGAAARAGWPQRPGWRARRPARSASRAGRAPGWGPAAACSHRPWRPAPGRGSACAARAGNMTSMMSTMSSSGRSRRTLSAPSASPRWMASHWWGWISARGRATSW